MTTNTATLNPDRRAAFLAGAAAWAASSAANARATAYAELAELLGTDPRFAAIREVELPRALEDSDESDADAIAHAARARRIGAAAR
jgi:hypothetical protein